MCCSADFSLKLIALACLAIMATDSFVLQQLVEKNDYLVKTTDPALYDSCFKPQLRMRMVFTCYAINSGIVTFLLTMGLICFDDMSPAFEKLISWLCTYMYMVFGPVLFTCCLFGFANMSALTYECEPVVFGAAPKVNMMDISVLFVCTAISALVLFIFGLMSTNDLAEKSLQDETSVFYQLFSGHLKEAIFVYQRKLKLEQQKQSLRHGSQPLTSDDDDEEQQHQAEDKKGVSQGAFKRASGETGEAEPLTEITEERTCEVLNLSEQPSEAQSVILARPERLNSAHGAVRLVCRTNTEEFVDAALDKSLL